MFTKSSGLYRILRQFTSKNINVAQQMAKSKFEYVRAFETEDKILPNCWFIIRIDGKAFHKFSKKHDFEKPNDPRALNLMNRAAVRVMQEFRDVTVSYGQSDEYSFVFRKDSTVYDRRRDKLLSYVCSLFTSAYVYHWKDCFSVPLLYPPSFDSRVVVYPSDDNLRDYLSWRQADTHINNLYNTTFWNLVQKGGLTNSEAEKRLSGTLSADKNEILFSEFGINYNNEPTIYRKGTTLLRKRLACPDNGKSRQVIVPFHQDMIQDAFWDANPEIFQQKTSGSCNWPEDQPYPELVLLQFCQFTYDKRPDEK